MKKAIIIAILPLVTSLASAQVTNLDFENWYTDTSGHQRLVSWEHLMSNTDAPDFGFFGTWRDSLAEHGMYALSLSRWYDYADDWVRQRAPITSSPAQLNGYYEYVDNTMTGLVTEDTALVQVFLTRWNSAAGRPDTVGAGASELTLNPVYAAFSCPIAYAGSTAPDSITINIFPTKWFPTDVGSHCASGGTCSYLTVDNLTLQAPAGITPVIIAPFLFFPNPTEGTLTVRASALLSQKGTLSVALTDCLGRIVLNEPLRQATTQIDLEHIKPGNYFIVFKDGNNIIQCGKITKD